MRSLFLIVLLNFLFFYCLPSFAQNISCWKSISGYSCSDGTRVDKTIGGFSIYKSDIHTMSEDSRESLRQYLCSQRSSVEVCLLEAKKREAKRSGKTTEHIYVPSVTCEQNSKNNTECFDKVTGRKWEIVP